MKIETVRHIANNRLGTSVRELLLEADEQFIYTALEKGLTEKSFILAWWLRDYHLVPMKFTLNRILNEHGRIFTSFEEQEHRLIGYAPDPYFVRCIVKFHRRIFNNKEYVTAMQSRFS